MDILSHIGLLHLPWMMEYGDIFHFSYVVFVPLESFAISRRLMSSTFPLCETQKWLCGTENVTKASIDMVVVVNG